MDVVVPPEELRVGVGPFADSELFVQSGKDTVALAQHLVGLDPSDRVLDVGCGCGRVALALGTYLSANGRYSGFDIDAGYVAWCKDHIERLDARFSFAHLDVQSTAYNPNGHIEAATATFPYPSDSFDCVLVSSVFTHMFEPAIERYVSEISRVLRPSGRALISALLMNAATRHAVQDSSTLFTFAFPLGASSWAMDADRPTEAVAVAESWLLAVLGSHGLTIEHLEYGDWRRRRSWAVQHDWLAVGRSVQRAA